MLHTKVNLTGSDWRLLPLMPNEWEWRRVWEKPQETCASLWIPAVVPGTVQDDARDAGLTPDFTRDFDSRACEWTSERDWVYLKEFPTPDLPPNGVVRLRFEGVDYACHVFLNGQRVGDHEGMYDAFEFDVTERLAKDGPNQLVVVVERAPREVGQIGRTSEVRLWKARFAYDWDWCTRLVPIGIFDQVSLEVTGPAWIKEVQVHTALSDDLTVADIGVSVDLGTRASAVVNVSTGIECEGGKVAEGTGRVLASGATTTHSFCARVENPRLWWPNGYGEQPLYEAAVAIRDEAGSILDERRVTFGVRRVRAVPNDNAPEDARPYVIEVNGRKVYLKGWNWAPISQLYGREMPERYERWLRLARNAHCNLLRIWGGGLLEKEVFYGLCDRLGIMVWQEFIQSSSGIDNRPSTAPGYLRYIRRQAMKMVPRKRNHPSLIIWCGGNELMHDDWRPLDDTHPALAVLKDAVQRLDPDRIYLPTSASGPVENASLDKVGQMHDVHGPWQYQGAEGHYRFYNGIDPLLHSEFGVEGAANLEAMGRSNTESLLWPPDATNLLWMHKGSWWIHREPLERVFGPFDDLASFVCASQFLQAEGLRYAIEANRRRKWHCAGTSPWQFNESWPNLACTNVVDYYGQPRPAYWWCRRAHQPLHPSARYDQLGWQPGETFAAEVWLNNSLDGIDECTVTGQVIDLRGNVLAASEEILEVPADCALPAGSVSWLVTDVPGGVFVLRLRAEGGGRVTAPNDYVFAAGGDPIFAPLRDLPTATLEVTRAGGALTLTNTGPVCAMFVRLESAEGAWLEFDLNYAILVPGESMTVTCAPAEEKVTVTGWNFPEVTV